MSTAIAWMSIDQHGNKGLHFDDPSEWLRKQGKFTVTALGPVAIQPAAPVQQEPSMWTVTHNGKSVTADSLFKAMKAAQALRTDGEAQIAAENLLRAVDLELDESTDVKEILTTVDAAPVAAQPQDVKAIHSAVLALQCDPRLPVESRVAFLAGVHRSAAVVSQFAAQPVQDKPQDAGQARDWMPMETAPKDGTMLRLLVQFDENATEDSAEPCPTIGANSFVHSGEDVWQFAGWNWEQDCFDEGVGTPVGWLPLLDAQAAPAVPDEWINNPDSIQKPIIDACHAAIRIEFGASGSDGYYKRILAKVFQAIAAAPSAPSVIWRCFHCDESFTDADQAALHFGPTQHHEPACQVSVEQLREMESDLRRYREEDTDLHRQIYGIQAAHAAALRREEEKGYARGLVDAAAAPSVSDAIAARLQKIASLAQQGMCHGLLADDYCRQIAAIAAQAKDGGAA